MRSGNPFAENPATDPRIESSSSAPSPVTATRSRSSSGVIRPGLQHRLRMLYHPQDAEGRDAGDPRQALTHCSRSRDAQLSHVALPHSPSTTCSTRSGRLEPAGELQFAMRTRSTARPIWTLPDQRERPHRSAPVVDEGSAIVHLRMLLCPRSGQRLIYILGEILDVTDAVGASARDQSRELPPATCPRAPRPA